MDDELIAYVNGKRYGLPKHSAEQSLLQYLRSLGLTGTKLGCGEGGCGACTVMLSSWSASASAPVHRAVNACTTPVYAIDGCAITTVEGIGSLRAGLHPIQARLASSHGSQCGFCTPGFVMSMYALLRNRRGGQPSEAEVEEALAGNLCRCTGYRPILDAFKHFTCDSASKAQLDNGRDAVSAYTAEARSAAGAPPSPTSTTQPICPSTGLPCSSGCSTRAAAAGECDCPPVTETRGSSELIFPPALRKWVPTPVTIKGPVATWHRPTDLPSLLRLLHDHPQARLVAGNTEIAIESRVRGPAFFPVLVSPAHVSELTSIFYTAGGREGPCVLRIGAAATLSQLEEELGRLIDAGGIGNPSCRGWAALHHQLRWFAGRQVRNVATVGGNIATGSPISDLNPLWIALGATVVLASAVASDRPGDAAVCDADQGYRTRRVAAADMFLGYRKTALLPGEVILCVEVPGTSADGLEFVHEFKQSHRREDDIALVNAGMRVKFTAPKEPGGAPRCVEAVIVYGGMAARTSVAVRASAAFVGQPWSREALVAASAALREDFPLNDASPGGMPGYRSALAASFLFKFWVGTSCGLNTAGWPSVLRPGEASSAAPEDMGGLLHPRTGHPPRGLQYWTRAADALHPVGTPLVHVSAEAQTTGEAQYLDDIPPPPGLLHAVRLLSDRPHAVLQSIDASDALRIPGVVGFYTAADVPGVNHLGPVLQDEWLFVPCGEVVASNGQALGVCVAESEAAARAAVRVIRVTYGPDLPSIMSIDAAIAVGSFFSHPRLTDHVLERGDAVSAIAAAGADPSLLVLSGEGRCGGQEHFYLEPHGALLLPTEGGGMDMVSSTQGPTDNQHAVAHVLGLPYNLVHCAVRRLGGGFGGKESKAAGVAAVAAVPAHILRRPVRLVLDRAEDMATTGGRHPFLGRYTAVVERATGRLHAIDLNLYSNGGHSMDLSFSVLDRALFHADGAYATPHLRVRGTTCRTNMPSNTAFRGFGAPQGALMAEFIVDHAARALRLRPEVVRAASLYGLDGTTHFGQVLQGDRLQRVWAGALAGCGADGEAEAPGTLEARREIIASFNASHRYRKRALSTVPVKFGIAFTARFMNQGGALVHIYRDGTILISHGGVEMGQGLHTKMIVVAAAALGVPAALVRVCDTSTRIVANTSPSAASASSDLYGGAVLDACKQLAARVAPYLSDRVSWRDAISAAYFDRVDLSAHGFFATGGLDWDWTRVGPNGRSPSGTPFNYFCYGASTSEVELDCLTGDLTVLRTDLIMDVGDSLNPAIDVGQIEGAFMQGMGWLMLEEVKFSDEAHAWAGKPGRCLTTGPGAYKIPSANDLPLDFRVTLLRGGSTDSSERRAVFSSKAVGEPPFLLALSVFFAAKEAVAAARADTGVAGEGPFQLDSPATPERLRLAVADEICASVNPDGGRGKLSC